MNLGMSISMFGCVGDDEIGDQILEAIEGAGSRSRASQSWKDDDRRRRPG